MRDPVLANALEIAHIKALELAEYEKSIDAKIEAFRKKMKYREHQA
ncbi:hypothetical protein QTL86_04510 [Cellulosilyticum sp. ST5]